MTKKVNKSKNNVTGALIYQPTKIDGRVIDAVVKDVKKKKFTSKNSGYNSILKSYYGIE